MEGFMKFVREQGVVGLAVGLVIGAAAAEFVGTIVSGLIDPIIGMALGGVKLADKGLRLGEGPNGVEEVIGTEGSDDVVLLWGTVLGQFIDFIVVVGFIYFAVKKLGLDKLDAADEDEE